MCIDRHLHTVARLPHYLENLDSLVRNLRNLKLKELLDKFCMGSGKNYAESVLIFLHFIYICLDTVVGMVYLSWGLIPLRKDSLGLAQVNKDVSIVLPLAVAYNHLSNFIDELGVDLVILDCLAPLIYPLMSTLDIHPPECLGVYVNKKLVADLTVNHTKLLFGFININFHSIVNDIINNSFLDLKINFILIIAELNFHAVDSTEFLLICSQHCIFDCLKRKLVGNTFFLFVDSDCLS